jgi:hypothetical protein
VRLKIEAGLLLAISVAGLVASAIGAWRSLFGS